MHELTAILTLGKRGVIPFAIETGNPPAPEPLTGWGRLRFIAKRFQTDLDNAAVISLTSDVGGGILIVDAANGRVDVDVDLSLPAYASLVNRRHRLFGELQGIDPDGKPEKLATVTLELEPRTIQAVD